MEFMLKNDGKSIIDAIIIKKNDYLQENVYLPKYCILWEEFYDKLIDEINDTVNLNERKWTKDHHLYYNIIINGVKIIVTQKHEVLEIY